VKVFEAQHRGSQSLDAAVVLFNDVNQVFALADFDAGVVFLIQLLEACGIGSTLINVDQARLTVFLENFLQKA